MGKRTEDMISLLSKKYQPEKSLQSLAKRMLIGFFVLMLVLTVLSRAADSVSVAKVRVSRIKSSVLNYELNGDGMIEAETEEYISLYEGARILSIEGKPGQSVKEGDLLFTYDLQDLETIAEDLRDAYTIAQLNYKKDKLGQESQEAANNTEAAEITLRRAELDLELAEMDLKMAKSKVEEKISDRLQAAKESYTAAKEAYEAALEDREYALKKGRLEVLKAEEPVEKNNKARQGLEQAIREYRQVVQSSSQKLPEPVQEDMLKSIVNTAIDLNIRDGDYYKTLVMIDDSFRKFLDTLYSGTQITTSDTEASREMDPLSRAKVNIYKQYYGEKEYEKHAKEIKKAKDDLERAKEDYLLTFISTVESGTYLTSAQKAACMRTYQDLYDALNELTEKDQKLNLALLTYGYAIQNKTEAEIEASYQVLFTLIYEEDENKLKEIKTAQDLLTAKQEELTKLTTDWNRTVEKAERELNKAQEEYYSAREDNDQLLSQTYDYTDETRVVESQVEAAKRNAEDAAKAVDQARASDERTKAANQTKKQIDQINLEIRELELKDKEEALARVEELINAQGKVLAPNSGILLRLDLSVGGKVAGTEKVSISKEDYGFHFKVTEKEAKYLAIGDEITITPNNSKKRITANLDSIGMVDSQGMSEITAVLPQGEYGEGSAASYTIYKRSKQYDQTIPLQAIRMDSNQVNYVLVIGESNTSLGNVLTAYRVNVTVLEKDYRTAAVEASIGPRDNIIISSNKNIEEGDRVRIYEENK